jgi:Apolipoprotein N-acyltransferase
MKLAKIRSVIPTWQNALLAVVAAVLLILAFPDFEIWWLAWFALVPLLWAIEREKESTARGFVLGWLFGTIFFFGTCWWLTFAPITYAGFPPVLAYFLLLLVCIAAGIFPAIFGGAMSMLLRRFGSVGILAAPFVWVFTEFARYWLTGNNWNAVGYSQPFDSVLLPMARIGGVLLVGWLSVLASASILLVCYQRTTKRLLVCLIPIGVWIGGAFALNFIDNSIRWSHKNDIAATVIALQPNVPMSGLTDEKWRELRKRHIRLAESALTSGIVGYSRMPYETKEDRKEDEEFSLDEFDKVAARFSIDSLRKSKILADSFEARIWVGNFPETERGLILSENSAKFVPPTEQSENKEKLQVQSLTPIAGWESVQEDITSLLNMPDEPPTERIEPANDSDAVIVEIKKLINIDFCFITFLAARGARMLAS